MCVQTIPVSCSLHGVGYRLSGVGLSGDSVEMEDEKRLRKNCRGPESQWWGEQREAASDAFELGTLL